MKSQYLIELEQQLNCIQEEALRRTHEDTLRREVNSFIEYRSLDRNTFLTVLLEMRVKDSKEVTPKGERGYYYLHAIHDCTKSLVAYKQGRTKTFNRRFGQQLGNIYKPMKYKVWACDNFDYIVKMENEMKRIFRGCEFEQAQEYYNHGYTETIRCEYHDEILKTISEYIERHNSIYPEWPITEQTNALIE